MRYIKTAPADKAGAVIANEIEVRLPEDSTTTVRVHRIALVPNNRQRGLLVEQAGYTRFAYNWALRLFQDGLDGLYGQDPERPEYDGRWFGHYDLAKIFNAIKADIAPWAKQLYQGGAEYAIVFQLRKAIERWGRDKANGFPGFRSRHSCMSFQVRNRGLKIDGRRIRLPGGIGWVRMRERLRFDGQVKQAQITEDAGRWFACVVVQTELQPVNSKRGGGRDRRRREYASDAIRRDAV